jgi:nicotinate-nucleotide adenylyltransferase
MRRICLFGGSFDPVHLGHMAMARAVLAEDAADHVVFLPAGQSPLKAKAMASGELRAEMLKLAIGSEPRFSVDGRELTRTGPSFTRITVAEYLRERPGVAISFLIGADQLATLAKWQQIDWLLTRVQFLTALRHPVATVGSAESAIEAAAAQLGGSEHALRLRTGLLDARPVNVASTSVRAAVARGDWAKVESFVGTPVAACIRAHGLYAAA